MKKTHIHPRRLARKMAKAQLDKAGLTGYNKEGIDINGKRTPSKFATNWKAVVKEVIEQPSKFKKRKGAKRK